MNAPNRSITKPGACVKTVIHGLLERQKRDGYGRKESGDVHGKVETAPRRLLFNFRGFTKHMSWHDFIVEEHGMRFEEKTDALEQA